MWLTFRSIGSGLMLSAALAAGPSVEARTIVQWGEAGGQSDIVSSDQPLKPNFPLPTYKPEVVNSPVSDDYYAGDAAEGKTPLFSAAAGRDGANQFYARLVQDNAEHGDRLHLGNHRSKLGETAQAMVVWRNDHFLKTGAAALDTLKAEAFAMQPNGATATIHFIFENGDGWFINEGEQLRGAFQRFGGSAAEMKWNTFTPLANGVATLGDAADPDMSDIRAVGVYFKVTASEPSNLGVFLRYFQATSGAGDPTPVEPE